ncbi:hypothetical protein K402DRAFT_175649 [Aulographum hederae CBS 113979]|uniref:Uncharacterized protein n=1 Tax=Aulographum hederae CBS 113979 TaxID=1176131 RepID=A0A6G1GQP6_9PEZI|nr:hypothetical protein K402DRAFT_175649 [Aulographum hederae CBS 113979]
MRYVSRNELQHAAVVNREYVRGRRSLGTQRLGWGRPLVRKQSGGKRENWSVGSVALSQSANERLSSFWGRQCRREQSSAKDCKETDVRSSVCDSAWVVAGPMRRVMGSGQSFWRVGRSLVAMAGSPSHLNTPLREISYESTPSLQCSHLGGQVYLPDRSVLW